MSVAISVFDIQPHVFCLKRSKKANGVYVPACEAVCVCVLHVQSSTPILRNR